MRKDILERREEILQWIREERSKRYICKQLACKPDTLNSYLKKMDIEYAGQQAKKGQYKGAVFINLLRFILIMNIQFLQID